MATPGAARANRSLTWAAIALAAATVILWLVLGAVGHDGAGWLVWGLLGLATALTAWRAGGASRRNVGALVALVIGVLAVVVFLGFLIADLVS